MINKPAVASHKFTVRDEDLDAQNRKIVATSAHELVAAVVTGGPAAIRLYDADDVNHLNELESILLTANAGESVPYTPAQLVPFLKGIIVVFEQGKGLNAELHLLFN